MKHRYKSIDGAVRAVKRAERYAAQWREAFKERASEAKMLAKLAAKGPAFFNPIEAMAAEEIRDRILREMGMNPDGTFKRAELERTV